MGGNLRKRRDCTGASGHRAGAVGRARGLGPQRLHWGGSSPSGARWGGLSSLGVGVTISPFLTHGSVARLGVEGDKAREG